MTLNQRIKAFVTLARQLNDEMRSGELHELLQTAYIRNKWFEPRFIRQAIEGIVYMLDEFKLVEWIAQYKIQTESPKRVGVVMAGNIPLVGFHDLLAVLVSGNKAVVKLSSDDTVLMAYVIHRLMLIDPEFEELIEFADRIKEVDAVIATGSNNSARYFEYYFSKIPHIIRKNRTSVAVLGGHETDVQLKALAADMLSYFGLGCRNVTKLYVPQDYVLDPVFESLIDYAFVISNNKYANNYEYNRTIYLMNSDTFLDNNFLMLKESDKLFSPVAVVQYQRYATQDELKDLLKAESDNIQCIVSSLELGLKTIPFGTAQQPELWDYPDGVDTMQFLLSI